jgi:hypothetical protein
LGTGQLDTGRITLLGRKITISPSAESEKNEYDIDADNWA